MRKTATVISAALLAAGCATPAPTTQPDDVRARQDAALRDPFGYKVDMSDRTVSGGKTNEYRKDDMKKDLNSVFNP